MAISCANFPAAKHATPLIRIIPFRQAKIRQAHLIMNIYEYILALQVVVHYTI